MARHIEAKWRSYGFDHVEMAKYDVLMNFPHQDSKQSRVEIHRDGKVVFESHPDEKASRNKLVSTFHVSYSLNCSCRQPLSGVCS